MRVHAALVIVQAVRVVVLFVFVVVIFIKIQCAGILVELVVAVVVAADYMFWRRRRRGDANGRWVVWTEDPGLGRVRRRIDRTRSARWHYRP
jgi:hypothetical protein